MSSHSINHVALRVESLRQAERFYSRLFDLEVLWRQTAASTGETCVARLLGRSEFRLILTADADEAAGSGRLVHIGARFRAVDLRTLADRAPTLGCRILRDEPDRIDVEDVYGVRWRIAASDTEGAEECCAEAP